MHTRNRLCVRHCSWKRIVLEGHERCEILRVRRNAIWFVVESTRIWFYLHESRVTSSVRLSGFLVSVSIGKPVEDRSRLFSEMFRTDLDHPNCWNRDVSNQRRHNTLQSLSSNTGKSGKRRVIFFRSFPCVTFVAASHDAACLGAIFSFPGCLPIP